MGINTRWALEVRNHQNSKLVVEVKIFESKDEAVKYAHDLSDGHTAAGNEYLYLLYKVYMMLGSPIVDAKFENLVFSRRNLNG